MDWVALPLSIIALWLASLSLAVAVLYNRTARLREDHREMLGTLQEIGATLSELATARQIEGAVSVAVEAAFARRISPRGVTFRGPATVQGGLAAGDVGSVRAAQIRADPNPE